MDYTVIYPRLFKPHHYHLIVNVIVDSSKGYSVLHSEYIVVKRINYFPEDHVSSGF